MLDGTLIETPSAKLEVDEMLVTEVLHKARRRVRWRWNWTKKTSARDIWGRVVEPTAPNAARFCISGAVTRAAHDLRAPAAVENAAFGRLGDFYVTANDEEGHRAILRRFDQAIATASH